MAAKTGLLLDVALWAWLAAVIVWTHTLRLTGYFNWDSQLFLAMGRWTAQGVVPYREALEVKPPGMFFYLGGLFLLSPTAWAIRLADVAWSVAAAWALVRLLRPEAGRLAAAVAATAWIGWHHHALFDHGGVYTEHYGALAGLIALACRGPIASGLWATAAGLFKHPGAAVLVAIGILRLPSWRLRDWGLFVAAVVVPLALLSVWLVAVGAWDNFLYANLWIVLTHGRFDQAWDYRLLLLWRSVAELAAVFPGMAAAVVLGLVATVFTRTPLALAASAWWLVAMAGVLLQGRYFEHHYLLVLPPIALLGGIGVGWLAHLRPGEHVVVRGLRLTAGAAVLWWGWGIVQAEYVTRREVFGQRWAQVVQGPSAWPVGPMRPFEAAVGRYIRERTMPDDRVHVQGFNPTLLHIYWYAERPPGAPLFYEVPFVLDRPLQLKQAIAGDPAYVVIDRAAPMDPFMLAWLERDYQVEQTFGETYVADVWHRRRDLADGDAPLSAAPPIVNPVILDQAAECRAADAP